MIRTETASRPEMSGLWGWGRSPGDGSLVPFSFEDIRRDTAAARAALRSLGHASDAVVLIVSTVSEFCFSWPFNQAAHELGYVTSTADATRFDAARTEMFCRLIKPHIVLGINDEVLDGLEEQGRDPGQVFSGVPCVIARGGAVPRLKKLGVGVKEWVALGPALAVECRHGRLHFDATQWHLDERGGELMVSSVGRALRAVEVPTGVRGRLSQRFCLCRRRDPWIEREAPGE